MTDLYGVLLRLDPDNPDEPRFLSSFFELTTDQDAAYEVAARVDGVVVRLGAVEERPAAAGG
ncbi:hypothetical protein [Streptomyces sp. NPDC056144]|uniref:hypothetical protein n=1 Tax=unclassified Streptomyces TaxID=2593676 RepID=UPI0035D62FE7